MILIVGLSIVIALAVNHFSPGKIALVAQWQPSTCSARADSAGVIGPDDFEIRDVFRAKALFDAGNVPFCRCARRGIFFKTATSVGRVTLPLSQFEQQIDSFKKTYPLNHDIVTYCYSGDCDDSRALARLLFEVGYTNVGIFIEGYLSWENEGFPIE